MNSNTSYGCERNYGAGGVRFTPPNACYAVNDNAEDRIRGGGAYSAPNADTPVSDATLSQFEGHNKPEVRGASTIADTLAAIRTDPSLAAFTANARRILAERGKDAYDAFKMNARGVTWAGEFSYRNEQSLVKPSGAVFIELDRLPNSEAVDAERASERTNS